MSGEILFQAGVKAVPRTGEAPVANVERGFYFDQLAAEWGCTAHAMMCGAVTLEDGLLDEEHVVGGGKQEEGAIVQVRTLTMRALPTTNRVS